MHPMWAYKQWGKHAVSKIINVLIYIQRPLEVMIPDCTCKLPGPKYSS